ncbi:MAG: hypothetical protein PHC88_08255 [Terrimicrobiaceae bacterium]|nr:hypothetical protein [Terrimicrobiaceae bacterium]
MTQMLRDYYREPEVRRCIQEFLGGDCIEHASCQYITADDTVVAHRRPREPAELLESLEQGLDIGRSLWDRESLIAHLDVEYVNFDFPSEAYLEPERIFDLQEPVERAIERLLAECGIAPLHVLSGRGHHFAWSIRQDSDVFERLAGLGHVSPSQGEVDSQPHPPHGESVSPAIGAAFSGLGLVMEFLAHRVKELAAPRCAIPVELTAVEVGPSAHGREMISVDISEYGDPLHTRTVRVPFGIYFKPWQLRHESGRELSPLVFVPLVMTDVHRGIVMMRDPCMAADLAGRVSTRIPDQSEGMRALASKYVESSLKGFHDWFYSQEHDPPESWSWTYDRTPLDVLPACARNILLQPNDLLLRPGGMRLITRVMLALGWHPRHIAGLIRSKFERDHGWGDQWLEYSPAVRADFYTRVFAGLFVVGRDDLVDFNCQSCREEKACPVPNCSENLELFRKSALARRKYDHLAHRPFNRLFLPDEHL